MLYNLHKLGPLDYVKVDRTLEHQGSFNIFKFEDGIVVFIDLKQILHQTKSFWNIYIYSLKTHAFDFII